MDQHIFFSFALACLLGALIGIEREMPRHSIKENTLVRFGGIRSYSLIGIFGALMAWLDEFFLMHGVWVIIGACFCIFFIGLSYTYSAFRLNRMGITSEYAGMMVYFSGVIAMEGLYALATGLTIVVLMILAAKDYLAKMREKIDREELMNTLKFAVIVLIILPVLPNQSFSFADILLGLGYDDAANWTPRILTMHFFNPYSLWRFVVIMAGVEFIGYILSKVIGSRGGILLSGAIGGLVSSTAVTASMTEQSKNDVSRRDMFVMATLVANLIMFVRVVVIARLTSLASPALFSSLIIPTGVMFLTVIAFVAYYGYKAHRENLADPDDIGAESFSSPFRIMPAIKFAGIILIVKFISAIGLTFKGELEHLGLGDIFYYILGLISGLADVDAITLDMSQKATDGSLAITLATATIIIAMMSNNFVKATIAWRLGEKGFGNRVFLALFSSIVVGIVMIIAISVFNS